MTKVTITYNNGYTIWQGKANVSLELLANKLAGVWIYPAISQDVTTKEYEYSEDDTFIDYNVFIPMHNIYSIAEIY